MAAATAPSREEVDLAHRKRKWLSIGLLSPRNLGSVSVQKVLACTLLALTSLPVHLFYNSVIFPSLSGNDYFWAVVTEDFLSGAPFNLSDSNYSWEPAESVLSSIDMVGLTPTPSQWTQWYQTIQRNASQYERLDNENCIKAYSQKLIPNRRHVVLVSSTKNATNSVLAFDASEIANEGGEDPTNWICSRDTAASDETCDASPFLQAPQDWAVFGFPIMYCLSEQTEGSCSVRFSSDLAVVIIVCNFIKLCVEIYILFFGGLDQALTCVGDAIASFLTFEDTQTRDMCLLSINEVSNGLRYPLIGRRPRCYLLSRPRWAKAISLKRWTLSLAILVVAVLLVAILYAIADTTGFGTKGFDTSARGLWKIGFGQIDPEILIASDNFGTPITLSLLANTPQLILAMIYYLYNGMLTSFFTAQEYSTFAFRSQNLRVASPAGNQASTWFLGMPWTWSILFLVMQTLLHWFVSQAFFVVEVSAFNEDGTLNTGWGSISNCGFSPLAMICAMVLTVIMMLLTIILGMRRFPAKSPPVAGNSSAAISAACHPGVYEEKTAFIGLKWACISSWPDGTGHCSFAVAKDEDGMGVPMEEVHEGTRYK
jgi:hypothetical protein